MCVCACMCACDLCAFLLIIESLARQFASFCVGLVVNGQGFLLSSYSLYCLPPCHSLSSFLENYTYVYPLVTKSFILLRVVYFLPFCHKVCQLTASAVRIYPFCHKVCHLTPCTVHCHNVFHLTTCSVTSLSQSLSSYSLLCLPPCHKVCHLTHSTTYVPRCHKVFHFTPCSVLFTLLSQSMLANPLHCTYLPPCHTVFDLTPCSVYPLVTQSLI